MYRWWETFTPTQGQYLALIDLYTRLHRRPLAETDLQEYFPRQPTPWVSSEDNQGPPQHRTSR